MKSKTVRQFLLHITETGSSQCVVPLTSLQRSG